MIGADFKIRSSFCYSSYSKLGKNWVRVGTAKHIWIDWMDSRQKQTQNQFNQPRRHQNIKTSSSSLTIWRLCLSNQSMDALRSKLEPSSLLVQDMTNSCYFSRYHIEGVPTINSGDGHSVDDRVGVYIISLNKETNVTTEIVNL